MTFKNKTTVSEKTVEILQASKQALSVPQLLVLLKEQGLTPNKTTLYRIIDKLIKTHFVSVVTLKNGVSYFEFSQKNHHHHHFYCQKCNQLYCLDQCLVESLNIDLNQLLPNQNFKIKHHDFNLYGICAPCSN